jgi:hypothetical protein
MAGTFGDNFVELCDIWETLFSCKGLPFFCLKTNILYQNEMKIKSELLIGNQFKLIFIHKEI